MAERKLSVSERKYYAKEIASRYEAEVESGIAQGWYRVPSLNSTMSTDVEDVAWQRFRGQRLKGKSTEEKLRVLASWLECWEGTDYEAKAKVQTENYLGALKRGGFVRKGENFWVVVR